MIDHKKYQGHTPGPWSDNGDPTGDIFGAMGHDRAIIECYSGEYGPHGADRALVIDAPMILAALRESEERVERLREALDSIIDDALDSANEYATRWGRYRKDIQEANYARVEKASAALAECEKGKEPK